MTYNEDCFPMRGDRVSFEHHGTMSGRVLGYTNKEVVIKSNKVLYKRKISEVIFLHACPWWYFWQKWRY